MTFFRSLMIQEIFSSWMSPLVARRKIKWQANRTVMLVILNDLVSILREYQTTITKYWLTIIKERRWELRFSSEMFDLQLMQNATACGWLPSLSFPSFSDIANMSFTSDELNFLVYRYLQESGMYGYGSSVFCRVVCCCMKVIKLRIARFVSCMDLERRACFVWNQSTSFFSKHTTDNHVCAAPCACSLGTSTDNKPPRSSVSVQAMKKWS